MPFWPYFVQKFNYPSHLGSMSVVDRRVPHLYFLCFPDSFSHFQLYHFLYPFLQFFLYSVLGVACLSLSRYCDSLSFRSRSLLIPSVLSFRLYEVVSTVSTSPFRSILFPFVPSVLASLQVCVAFSSPYLVRILLFFHSCASSLLHCSLLVSACVG